VQEGAELRSRGTLAGPADQRIDILVELGWGKTCRESSIMTTPLSDPYGSEEIYKTNKHNACGNYQ